MTVFLSTINQMGFLLLLIIIGYIVSKLKVIPDNSAAVLSKLENNLFIPALVLGTFMTNFTVDKLGSTWQFLLGGFIVIGISMPIAVVLAKLNSKDEYVRKIYTYGLAFSNFGFMGNAVFKALFPEVFMEYLIFVLPFWIMIYLWGVPTLLIPSTDSKGIKGSLKSLINPMFVAMIIGMVIGIINIPLPSFVSSTINTLGDCMSPIAMVLTGITISKIDLGKAFKNISIYIVSFIRLIAIPLVAIVILRFLPLSDSMSLCVICSLAMPLGLNTIVVPAGYGKDTSVASGMALISHLLSCITIPVIFMIYNLLV